MTIKEILQYAFVVFGTSYMLVMFIRALIDTRRERRADAAFEARRKLLLIDAEHSLERINRIEQEARKRLEVIRAVSVPHKRAN